MGGETGINILDERNWRPKGQVFKCGIKIAHVSGTPLALPYHRPLTLFIEIVAVVAIQLILYDNGI